MFGFSAAQLLALGLAMTSALASPMPQDPAAAAPQLRVFYCKSIEFDGECATQKIGLHKCGMFCHRLRPRSWPLFSTSFH